MTHNFILTEEDARTIGNAVSRRDTKTITDMLADPVTQLEEHYDEISIDELKGEWQAEIARLTGLDKSLPEIVADKELSAVLEQALTRNNGTDFELRPIAYTKLLRTILYATMDDDADFSPRISGPRRGSTSQGRLHNRVNHLIASQADREIGVRGIREGILDLDETVLDVFLENYSRVRLAQNVIAEALEASHEGRLSELKRKTLEELSADVDFDELLGTHILTWTMLPAELASSPDRNRIIKKKIKDEAKTDKQRKSIEDNWHDERIDLLFEVAHIAKRQGRDATIHISNTFDGGAGLYLAAELTHPADSEKRIVVADNPIFGNAIYMVDELTTESDSTGRQFGWKEVLGTYRKIARKRGARRRYHTGDWMDIARAVCSYSGNERLAKQKQSEADERARQSALSSMSASEVAAALGEAIKHTEDILGTKY